MSRHGRTIGSVAGTIATYFIVAPAHAQFATAPIVPPTFTGETALQKSVATAVTTMCVHALDNNGNLNLVQQDLHEQCHAIAAADIFAGSTAGGSAGNIQSTLGALTQVSGNQVTTQGALATRVAAGQFANISGRLNALRFGSAMSLGQGRVATINSPTGTQSFYADRSTLDSSSQADGFAPMITPPLQTSQSQGAFNDAVFMGDGSGASYSNNSGSATAAPLPTPPNPWGLFVQGSYTSGHHDLSAAEDPFHFHAASVTAGMDYNFGAAVLGASIGFDDYDASFLGAGSVPSGGSARVRGTSGSLYGAWFGEHWTFSGIGTYGSLTTNLSRVVSYSVTYLNGFDPLPASPADKDNCVGATCTVTTNNTLTGSPHGSTGAVGVTAGYQYTAYSWDITPSLSANYRHASFDSFSESAVSSGSGAGLALAFGNQAVESTRSILGLDISRPISTPFGVLTPVVRGEWDHEFETGVRTVNAHYAYDPSLAFGQCLSCFALPTDAVVANYGIVGAGVSVALAQRIQAYVYDEVLVGYTNYQSNSIAIGLRGQL